MSRRAVLAAALMRCGFYDTGAALAVGEPVNARGLLRMLRWAVRHYRAERATMAHALKLGKAWARSEVQS